MNSKARLLALSILSCGLVAPAQVHRPVVKSAMHRIHKDPHPALHHAMAKLIAAKKDLKDAAKEYGGHRGAAILAIDNAMREIDLALKSDKK